jgi:hypothetical protein
MTGMPPARRVLKTIRSTYITPKTRSGKTKVVIVSGNRRVEKTDNDLLGALSGAQLKMLGRRPR